MKLLKEEARKSCEILKLNNSKFESVKSCAKKIEEIMKVSMNRNDDLMWGVVHQYSNHKKPRQYIVNLIHEYDLIIKYIKNPDYKIIRKV